jgi:hypothetical protein
MGKDEEPCALGSGHGDGLRKGSGDGLKAEQITYNAVALKLEFYLALLKSVNVVKTVSYINYEDCVARDANGEECRRGFLGYSRERASRVFNTLESMKKAGFTCKGEAIIYLSMNTIFPTCLGELTGKNTESTHPMPSLPTHGHWTSKEGQLGRCCDILHCISNVKRTLETQQKSHFAGNLVGSGVTAESSFSTHFLIGRISKICWMIFSLSFRTLDQAPKHGS